MKGLLARLSAEQAQKSSGLGSKGASRSTSIASSIDVDETNEDDQQSLSDESQQQQVQRWEIKLRKSPPTSSQLRVSISTGKIAKKCWGKSQKASRSGNKNNNSRNFNQVNSKVEARGGNSWNSSFFA